MKKNIQVIIFGFVLYVIAFQIAGYLFELYIVHIKGPVLPIVLLEQSIIPFIFGFYVYKYLQVYGKLSPLIVLIMPVCLIIPSTIWDIIQGEDVTTFMYTGLYITVVVIQLVFVVFGAYIQFFKLKSENDFLNTSK